MTVTFVNLNTLPTFLPIPEFNRHVIGGCENKWLRGVNSDRSNIVRVSFERCDLLRCIVVVDAELEIVGAADDPVLAGNESSRSHRDIGKFKSFDN